MKRPLSILVMLLMAAITAHGAEVSPSDLDKFLSSRKVIGTIPFEMGSADLNLSAQREIDRIVPSLKKIDSTQNMIRVEGFSSADGSEDVNVPLSMLRAKAVIDYLKSKYRIKLDYLTGYGASKREPNKAKSGRAELAVYDGTWDFGQISAQKSIVR